MQSKKSIIDSLLIILTRFQPTDDSRLDADWLGYKVDQVRSELIVRQYLITGTIDHSWLSYMGLIPFYEVSDTDTTLTPYGCPMSKATIPQTISLQDKDGNLDLGIFSLISPYGGTAFYPKRMSQWKYEPSEHTNTLFGSYDRINTTLYVNKLVTQLKGYGLLLSPEDGYIVNSVPILSGSIVSGTVYKVFGGQIIYNGLVYAANSTFTGASPTTFTGSGIVYLNSQVTSYLDTSPYPASGEMIRAIELEILTKEFGVEKQQVADIRNDSKDDASQSQ